MNDFQTLKMLRDFQTLLRKFDIYEIGTGANFFSSPFSKTHGLTKTWKEVRGVKGPRGCLSVLSNFIH